LQLESDGLYNHDDKTVCSFVYLTRPFAYYYRRFLFIFLLILMFKIYQFKTLLRTSANLQNSEVRLGYRL